MDTFHVETSDAVSVAWNVSTRFLVVTIHPEAFERGMAEVVAKHEAIHAVINDRGKRSHGELFQAIGREMGIADKYLD